MELLKFFVLIVCGIFGSTMASTLKPDSEFSIEDSVMDLGEKLRSLEIRLLLSELESKNELFLKMQEVEMETLKHRAEILQKVAGVEMRCMESTAELLGKLQNAENRFLKVDNHLLMEVYEVQKKSSDTLEMVHSVELELRNALKEEQIKTENLQGKQNEIQDVLNSFLTSQQDIKGSIRNNLSSTTEELRTYIDDRFKGFENTQSALEDRIRTFENSLLKLERELAILGVPEQNELSANISRTELPDTKTRWRCAGKPPSLQNGKALLFERSFGSTVQYKCNRDFVMTGNSTVRCGFGTWEGEPPTCVFFDETFVLESTPLIPENVYCYSDENHEKIQFSRVLETGRDESLSRNTIERTEQGKYHFRFTDENYSKRIGAFQCELKTEHGYMKIVTVIQRAKSIADMTFLDPFRRANIGDSVELKVDLGRKLDISVKWKHNGQSIPSWDGLVQVDIQNVQTTDAGIYECYYPGRTDQNSHAIMRLIVRSCKENFYGKSCENKCPPCYNGGICHDLLGICVCPAGFTGSNCEGACDGRHFGVSCSKECYSVMCVSRYFCKPDPYGCACAPGHTGSYCRQKCDPGWYGADCKQPCHCANGPNACNIYNGVCTGGCSTGWTGQSCQIEVAAQQSTMTMI